MGNCCPALWLSRSRKGPAVSQGPFNLNSKWLRWLDYVPVASILVIAIVVLLDEIVAVVVIVVAMARSDVTVVVGVQLVFPHEDVLACVLVE